MKDNADFSTSSFTPLYRQFMDYIIGRIRSGDFPQGEALPSIHAMVIRTGISRETVVKGYAELCREGVLVSRKGKGYFVKDSYLTGILSVMVLMDKMSTHQQRILDGFIAMVHQKAEITIRMHYQNVDWLSQALDAALDRYDWYLLFPHFPRDIVTQETVAKLIAKIPPQKLILADHLPSCAAPESGAVFQSISTDVPRVLKSVIADIRKYRRLLFIPLSTSLYGEQTSESIRQFGKDESVDIRILDEIPEKVQNGDLFFVSGSRLDFKLSQLLRTIANSGLVLGKEVGLICYNDSPLAEFIFGGITTLSVDFEQMGRIAGQMVLDARPDRVQCYASLIRRNTF